VAARRAGGVTMAVIAPDLCVIGGGSGGLSVAAAAAAFGVDTVLVERGAMGGDCLNTGCVPSKALLAAAKAAQGFRDSARFGIAPAEPAVDFAAVRAHVRGVIAAIAPHDSVERFTALGVRVIAGEARFLDPRTVVAGDHRIRARRFVIATGSRPAVPPIPGLADVPVLTNESLFDLDELPGHLAVIGGGPIGLEMAQAFRRLGARVTVLEAERALGREDSDLAAVVVDRLRAEGIDLRERVAVTAASGRAGAITLTVVGAGGESRVEATHLLVAAGRRPNVETLGLDAAGIHFDRRGIIVDRGLRSSNRRVYAVGDVAGGLQFTHVAAWQAGQVIRSILFRLPGRATDASLPRATYTDPELAQVGLSQDEARRAGRAVTVLTAPFADNDRARAEASSAGLVKLVADRRGRLLGAGIVGPGAGEAIALYGLALAKRANLRDLAGLVPAYPTRAEAGKRAALSHFAPLARRPLVRRLIRLLSRFG